jgi:pseudaminic acid cytidylyltransferase
MSSIVIIPARGGSKRIPMKNIKEFNGQPIIAYPIQTALNSKLFDEVMVSTDSDDIIDVAKKFGAKVPFIRSEANSNDFATLADVLVEVILKYKELGKHYDTICCILPTAALISTERLIESYNIFKAQNYNSLVPVVKFGYPLQRALAVNNGLLQMREPQHLTSRSQDLEPYYHDAAQFYWIKTESLLNEKTILTKKTGHLELKETEAQDVDTYLDWEMLIIKKNSLSHL